MKKSISQKNKYINIILAIILLLILTFAMLGLSYWVSQKSVNNANIINASARQSTLAQNIKNSVYNIDLYTKQLKDNNDRATVARITTKINIENNKLSIYAVFFEETLNAFKNGGNIKIDNNNTVVVKALKDNDTIKVIDSAIAIWGPYNRLIQSFGKSIEDGTFDSSAIDFATDYARIFNDRLSAEIETITSKLSKSAKDENSFIKTLLIIGSIIFVIIFLYIIFVALRQLIKTDEQLTKAQQETDDIMQTVGEGLFLIDETLTISEQYSKELENILGLNRLSNKNLKDILNKMISAKDLETVGEFIEQLFNKMVFEDLIEDLNPLDKVRFYIDDALTNSKKEKYLSFNFKRVYENDEIKRILVDVSDITKIVNLEDEIITQNKKHSQQISLLSTVLNSNPKKIKSFIEDINNSIISINNTLKSSKLTSDGLQDKITYVAREVNILKNEAVKLKLDSYISLLDNFLTALISLQRNRKASNESFLSTAVYLDEMSELTEIVSSLMEKTKNDDKNDSDELTTDNLIRDELESNEIAEDELEIPEVVIAQKQLPKLQLTTQSLNEFAQNIAAKNDDKKVMVQLHGLQELQINKRQLDILTEITLQLLHNAIVHGIEQPPLRLAQGKEEVGKITIKFAMQDEDKYIYRFEDDGLGIDFAALTKRAYEEGYFQKSAIAKPNQKEIIAYMFSAGASSATKSNNDGSRLCLETVKNKVKELGAKMQVASKEGAYTAFIIVVPK